MPHLYPTGQGFVHEYPTAEIDVDDETAAMLLGYHPPIFSLDPTGWPPPETPPTADTQGPADAGPSDSTPEA